MQWSHICTYLENHKKDKIITPEHLKCWQLSALYCIFSKMSIISFFFFGKLEQDTYIWVPITGSLLLSLILTSGIIKLLNVTFDLSDSISMLFWSNWDYFKVIITRTRFSLVYHCDPRVPSMYILLSCIYSCCPYRSFFRCSNDRLLFVMELEFIFYGQELSQLLALFKNQYLLSHKYWSLVAMHFCIFKFVSETWLEGNSLYLVKFLDLQGIIRI